MITGGSTSTGSGTVGGCTTAGVGVGTSAGVGVGIGTGAAAGVGGCAGAVLFDPEMGAGDPARVDGTESDSLRASMASLPLLFLTAFLPLPINLETEKNPDIVVVERKKRAFPDIYEIVASAGVNVDCLEDS